MVLTIIAAVVFLAHVAVWLGMPAAGRVRESAPTMSLSSAPEPVMESA